MILKRLTCGISLLLVSCSSSDKRVHPNVKKCLDETNQFIEKHEKELPRDYVKREAYLNNKLNMCIEKLNGKPFSKRVKYDSNIHHNVFSDNAKINLSIDSSNNSKICKGSHGKLLQSSVLLHIPTSDESNKHYINQARGSLKNLYMRLSDKRYRERFYRRSYGRKAKSPQFGGFVVKAGITKLGEKSTIRSTVLNDGFFLYDGEVYQYFPSDSLLGIGKVEKVMPGYATATHLVDDQCLSSSRRSSHGYLGTALSSGVFALVYNSENSTKGHISYSCYRNLADRVEKWGTERKFQKVVPLIDDTLAEMVESYSIKPKVVNAMRLRGSKDWGTFIVGNTKVIHTGMTGANKIKFNITLNTEKICSSIIPDEHLKYK